MAQQRGRGEFKLSLYGGSPEADFDAIVREGESRRINHRAPANSLLLAKPTGYVDHGGGLRLDEDGPLSKALTAWISSGAKRGEPRRCIELTVTPNDALIETLPAKVQLDVVAKLDNGENRDVTNLAVYTTGDESAVEVSPAGEATVMRRGAHTVSVRFMSQVVAVRITVPLSPSPLNRTAARRQNFIDDHVNRALARLRISPAPQADDAKFLRRVRLDLTGRLPAVAEVKGFLADDDPDKRTALVNRLLASPEFNDYWTLRLATWLRIRAAPTDDTAARTFTHWVRQRVQADAPLDEMARAMVTASGDTHTVGPANFYRQATGPRQQAEYFSEVLLGVRLRCANCHNHPLDHWTQADYHGLAAIFARLEQGRQVRLTTRGEVTNPATGEAAVPRLPGQRDLPTDGDQRLPLAQWLTAKDNPYFARAMVNRLWQAMLGRGLVEPVDDFRTSNPATHPLLLDALADDFAEHGYRLRHTLRQIATSAAYARASQPQRASAIRQTFYAQVIAKPLPAEVWADAIADVTGVPEKFTKHPSGTRAVELLGPSVKSPALNVLGRCDRVESCESTPTATGGLRRSLHLLNGKLLNAKIEDRTGHLASMIDAGDCDQKIVATFYHAALSRPPTEAEQKFWQGELATDDDEARRRRLEDFVWSLLSSWEFTHNR